MDHSNKEQEFVPDSSHRAEPSIDHFNSCFHFTKTVGALHPDRIWGIWGCHFSNLDVFSFCKVDFCGDDFQRSDLTKKKLAFKILKISQNFSNVPYMNVLYNLYNCCNLTKELKQFSNSHNLAISHIQVKIANFAL